MIVGASCSLQVEEGTAAFRSAIGEDVVVLGEFCCGWSEWLEIAGVIKSSEWSEILKTSLNSIISSAMDGGDGEADEEAIVVAIMGLSM